MTPCRNEQSYWCSSNLFFTLLDHKQILWTIATKGIKNALVAGSPKTESVWIPEGGFEDLPRHALFGVVVVSVEKVSKHSLVCWDLCNLNTVDSLSAGLRQRQARPPIWPTLVVFDTPEVEKRSRALDFHSYAFVFIYKFYFWIISNVGKLQRPKSSAITFLFFLPRLVVCISFFLLLIVHKDLWEHE